MTAGLVDCKYFLIGTAKECHQTLIWISSLSFHSAVCNSALIECGLMVLLGGMGQLGFIGWERQGRRRPCMQLWGSPHTFWAKTSQWGCFWVPTLPPATLHSCSVSSWIHWSPTANFDEPKVWFATRTLWRGDKHCLVPPLPREKVFVTGDKFIFSMLLLYCWVFIREDCLAVGLRQ